MNHSPAYIITQYLISEGLLTDPQDSGDWPVYVGSLPDGDDVVDDAVGCFDQTPVKDGRLMQGENIFHAGGQILLRAKEYNTGYAKAQAIATALEQIDRDEQVIGSDTYRIDNVTQTTGVVVIGQEEENSKRRELFSVNFITTLKEV